MESTEPKNPERIITFYFVKTLHMGPQSTKEIIKRIFRLTIFLNIFS